MPETAGNANGAKLDTVSLHAPRFFTMDVTMKVAEPQKLSGWRDSNHDPLSASPVRDPVTVYLYRQAILLITRDNPADVTLA